MTSPWLVHMHEGIASEFDANFFVPYDIFILVVVCYINTVHQSFFPSVVHDLTSQSSMQKSTQRQKCRYVVPDSSKPCRVAKKGM
jgi:hypothetical protein